MGELAVDILKVIVSYHDNVFSTEKRRLGSIGLFHSVIGLILDVFTGFSFPLEQPFDCVQESQYDRFMDYVCRWINDCFPNDIYQSDHHIYKLRDKREICFYSNIFRDFSDGEVVKRKFCEYIKIHITSKISVS